jgi:hypothetical protein
VRHCSLLQQQSSHLQWLSLRLQSRRRHCLLLLLLLLLLCLLLKLLVLLHCDLPTSR